MKIIHDLWFNTLLGSAGIVVGEDENTGERKLYVGVGSGQSLERAQQEVVRWGTKLSLERLDEIRGHLAPKPVPGTPGSYPGIGDSEEEAPAADTDEYVVLDCEHCKKPVVKLHKGLLSRIKEALHYDEGHGPHFYHPDCPGGFQHSSKRVDEQ